MPICNKAINSAQIQRETIVWPVLVPRQVFWSDRPAEECGRHPETDGVRDAVQGRKFKAYALDWL